MNSTRQQEGDEAAVKAVYPDAEIYLDLAGGFAVGSPAKGVTVGDGKRTREEAWTDVRSKLPATVHPEDETTLPATTRPKLHILFDGMARVYDHTEADKLFVALESERDSLKDELLLHVNRTLRNAVVGQETPQAAWERGWCAGATFESGVPCRPEDYVGGIAPLHAPTESR